MGGLNIHQPAIFISLVKMEFYIPLMYRNEVNGDRNSPTAQARRTELRNAIFESIRLAKFRPSLPLFCVDQICSLCCLYTLRLFNIAIEHGTFIVDLSVKNGDFP